MQENHLPFLWRGSLSLKAADNLGIPGRLHKSSVVMEGLCP